MRTSFNRRTATKVVDGKTRRKNRSVPTTHRGYVIDREPPGRGCRHVVTKRDVQSFVELIPDWAALSQRIERIVLAARDEDADGTHEFFHREETAAIRLYAWEKDLWVEWTLPHVEAHRELLERLGVPCEIAQDHVTCRFTEAQARAFSLLHVFMHELGHHWDRMHQKHRHSTCGEDFAEAFANRHLDQLLPRYIRVFGNPAGGQ